MRIRHVWAQMALEKVNPHNASDWAEHIIQKCEDELAG